MLGWATDSIADFSFCLAPIWLVRVLLIHYESHTLLISETGSYAAHVGLKLSMQPTVALKLGSSCLCLLSAKIPGMC